MGKLSSVLVTIVALFVTHTHAQTLNERFRTARQPNEKLTRFAFYVRPGGPDGYQATSASAANLTRPPNLFGLINVADYTLTDGPSPTSAIVGRAHGLFASVSTMIDFGALLMADDALTVGPEPGSEEIGRAQGMYGQAALEGIKFHMDLNLVFTKGKYKDSTLALVGWNPIFVKSYREMSIVGGSGYFRLARGVATAKTYQFDPVSANAIVEYHVVVLHY